MAKQSKSLTDEIYDEFYQLLKDSKEFDDDILDLVITKGGMRKHQQVIEILKKSMETKMKIIELEIYNMRGIRDILLTPKEQNLVVWGH